MFCFLLFLGSERDWCFKQATANNRARCFTLVPTLTAAIRYMVQLNDFIDSNRNKVGFSHWLCLVCSHPALVGGPVPLCAGLRALFHTRTTPLVFFLPW